MQAWSATKPKDPLILCVGRALRHKGHIEAMAAITRALASRARMERALHGVRPCGRGPGAGDRSGASRCGQRFQRPDQGQLERSLRRGQGGMGACRGRNGADDRPRTVRPNGARGDGERRGADHLGARRPGGVVAPARCRSNRATPTALRRRSANCWMRRTAARSLRVRDASASRLCSISERSRGRWTNSSRLASVKGADKPLSDPDRQAVVRKRQGSSASPRTTPVHLPRRT